MAAAHYAESLMLTLGRCFRLVERRTAHGQPDHCSAADRQGAEPGGPVQRRPEVIPVPLMSFAGVDSDANPDLQTFRPIFCP
jgi:hypothetical protein